MIKENMKKIKMQNRNELIFMFAFLVSSCLKETAVPIWNSVEERASQQTLRVDSTMTIDFDFPWQSMILLRELSPSSTKAKVEANTSGHLKEVFPLHPTDSIRAR